MQRHGHHPSDEIAVPFCCCLFVTRHNQIQQFSDPTYQSIYPDWYGSKWDISSLYHKNMFKKVHPSTKTGTVTSVTKENQ